MRPVSAQLQDDLIEPDETARSAGVQPKPRLEIGEVFDNGVLRVTGLLGKTRRLVVSFSGIGRLEDQRQPEEFVATASRSGQDHVLFVMDSSRSWFNLPGMDTKILEIVREFQGKFGITETKAIGDSMGGFCAMILPSLLPVSAVFASAPQFSVDPAVVPGETRWAAHRARLGEIRCSKISDYLRDETLYVVVHGGVERESLQRELFPRQQNLWHFVQADTGHDVAARLRQASLLGKVVQATFARRAHKVGRLLSGPDWTRRSGGKPVMT